jgi:catechol 2,3-dioxygenase-like lactoylglutathione lyase family enzyme
MTTATENTLDLQTNLETKPETNSGKEARAAVIPVRFHLSLNVSDIPQAAAFFERVLGVPPVKLRADYAKFELDSPPLVFSLEPRSPALHGSLNHIGFRFADVQSLVDVQRRLEEVGIKTDREEGVECCYAKQTKFWVHDLDRRMWEFYVLEGDIEHRGSGQLKERVLDPQLVMLQQPATPVVYENYMGQPFAPPERCDEIRMRGSFNVPQSLEQVRQTLLTAKQHLKPGGKIHLHQLTSDRPVPDEVLSLPGRAAVVKHVPVRTDLLQALQEIGFQQVVLTKFGANPCFDLGGSELRETMIEARLPAAEQGGAGFDATGVEVVDFDVVYKGPFASLQDDAGNHFKRGERVAVSAAAWNALEVAGVAGQFTRIAIPSGKPVSCGVSN